MEPTRASSDQRTPRGKIKPLESNRYGRLSVLGWRDGGWECACDCGTVKVLTGTSLRAGAGSCGCANREATLARSTKHGGVGRGKKTRAYYAWMNMRQRCYNPTNNGYQNYGGRGITVCDRWQAFAAFLEDMGEPGPGQSLDRIDVNGNYIPGNCRWTDRKTQARNTRRNLILTIDGEAKTLPEWCEETGINYHTAHERLKNGVAPELAIQPPAPKPEDWTPKPRRGTGAGWRYGADHQNHKLTPDDVRWIREHVEVSSPKAAVKFGVCPQLIRQIRARKRWTWLP